MPVVFIIVLFFLNYIPYSKHVHLLGALPNIALRNRGQKGVLPKRDLTDEAQWAQRGLRHDAPTLWNSSGTRYELGLTATWD